MRINFVMSNKVYSGIFDAIISYFKTYLPEDHELYVSEFPLDNMDIYHYHRPNLEEKLMHNSVVTVHHDLDDTDPWFDANKFIGRYKEADTIICLNSIQKNILESRYHLKNTYIVPHGVNKEIFTDTKRNKRKNSKFNILIVSKYYLRRVKGEAYLYELFKRLDSEKISFTFVGEGRSIQSLEAKNFGFETKCFEYLPYEMFDSLYHEADILLIPSLFEGGPANIPEALYTRTPIIGRDIAMIHDYLKEGVNGYFLSGYINKDAELLNSLAIDKDSIFSKLLDNINSLNLNIFSWKDVVLEHIVIYEKLLEKKSFLDKIISRRKK